MSFWLKIEPGRPRHPKWANLTDEEYRFADKLLCYGAEHETDVIPERVLYDLAGSVRRGKRLAAALVDAGKCMQPRPDGSQRAGILEPIQGGWRIHHAKQYWPPTTTDAARPSPTGNPGRSRALSDAGRRGAAKRWAKGKAMPTGHPEAIERPSANDGQGHETDSLDDGLAIPPPPTPSPSGTVTETGERDVVAEAYRFYARGEGERPRLRPELLPTKTTAKKFGSNPHFEGYARELGLSANQYADALADFQEKLGERERDPQWLTSKLCRFIEQAAHSAGSRRAAQAPDDKSARELADDWDREAAELWNAR